MKINTLLVRGSVLAVTMGLALGAQAADISWLKANNQDHNVKQLVKSAAAAPLSANANRNTELVEFQWALDSTSVIESVDKGSSKESRQYWIDVTAEELSRGINLHTTSKAAVIRVSPQNAGSTAKLSKDKIQLSSAGRSLDINSSVTSFADANQLRASGAPFAEGTIAFQLNNSVAAGSLRLAVDNLAASNDRYSVHVFEPNSTAVSKLNIARASYLTGHTIDASLEVAGATGNVSAYLISPDGKTTVDVSFNRAAKGYSANVAAPQAQGLGLWELHTHFEGVDGKGQQILRDTKVAFNVSAATARINNQAQLLNDGTGRDGQVALQLGVEVAAAGRYQLSGVIYGTGKNGALQPVALAQSAQWLEAGQQQLPLTFNVNGKGVSAPFEIRDLRLQDQSRLGILHRQERALSIR